MIITIIVIIVIISITWKLWCVYHENKNDNNKGYNIDVHKQSAQIMEKYKSIDVVKTDKSPQV